VVLPLAVGNSFQLFSAPSMVSSFSSISPATPGPGLAWDTSQLNSFGTLNVIAGASQPVVSSVRIVSGNLVFKRIGRHSQRKLCRADDDQRDNSVDKLDVAGDQQL